MRIKAKVENDIQMYKLLLHTLWTPLKKDRYIGIIGYFDVIIMGKPVGGTALSPSGTRLARIEMECRPISLRQKLRMQRERMQCAGLWPVGLNVLNSYSILISAITKYIKQ